MNQSAKLKFGAIEIGRGVASTAVVLHHSGSIMSQPRFFGAVPFDNHLANFNVGVDFFFVLSGFVIAWIHSNDIGQPGKVRDYSLKRFLRIFPPYWGILLPLVALYLMFPQGGTPEQRDPANIILSIFLLPYVTHPVLGVAWTLTHEVLFYILFAGIIAGGRSWLLLLPLWAVAIVAGHLAGPLPFPFSFLLSPFNIEFIFGVGAAVLLNRRIIPLPGLLLGVGIIAFLGLMLFAVNIQDDPLVGRFAFGLPATLFVLGSVELERRRPFRLPAWLAFFGASSYAVYLAHPVAISFFVRPLRRFTGHLGLNLNAIIIAVIAIAVGMTYHIVVERRLIALARRVIDAQAAKAAPRHAGEPR